MRRLSGDKVVDVCLRPRPQLAWLAPALAPLRGRAVDHCAARSSLLAVVAGPGGKLDAVAREFAERIEPSARTEKADGRTYSFRRPSLNLNSLPTTRSSLRGR